MEENNFFLEVIENSRKIKVNSTSNTVFQKYFKHIKNSSIIQAMHGIQVQDIIA